MQIPKKSYDLIDVLDEEIKAPELPTTAAGMGLLGNPSNMLVLAFQQGMRATVQMLIDEREAEVAAAEAEIRDRERGVVAPTPIDPRTFDTEGTSRDALSPRDFTDDVDASSVVDGRNTQRQDSS